MNAVRRWIHSFSARVETVINEMENHDALIDRSLREVRESAGRAKVQLGRVTKDGERLERELDRQRELTQLWRDRAVKAAALDQAKALECLKRGRAAERLAKELTAQLDEHRSLQTRLQGDLVEIERRIQHLTQRQHLLRTRQSRAEALRALQSHDNASLHELDSILERWDARITAYEYGAGYTAPEGDSLTLEFESEEERASLQAELAAMIDAANG